MIGFNSHGRAVKELQLQLKAAGCDPGDIDGIFGQKTQAAVKTFQERYEQLPDTGVFDFETAAALAQALGITPDKAMSPEVEPAAQVACKPEIWSAFLALVELITKTPVCYGPGRGLFRDGAWIITHGPGVLGSKSWQSHRGKTYPSFHCSSWTNFFLGWLLRRNEQYTHCGNIPTLFELCEQTADVHAIPGGGSYRGYGPYCQEIESNDDTRKRTGLAGVLDLRELYERRATLPTFLVCGQSTRFEHGWRWWHHTVLLAIDHASAGAPMFRLAADGVQDSRGWSGAPMEWIEITPATLPSFDRAIYRGYGVVSADGSYGGDQPLAPVALEP
ncbi:MAG TPA: peptidoglycan-binding domain-containing protein [Kofleriaceae bacterium]|nr:peptidoglycan-binding domain-containing protein [Kofleriaceae bacterium]